MLALISNGGGCLLWLVTAAFGVPSEALRLRWSHIDWGNDRFVIESPKTEHHSGHESRIVPIFPELAPCLREAFEQAEDGSEFCIMRYRDTASNLRTQFKRIIARAGLEPWPKLWQNPRSTRETELADDFPAHVVSAWMGNSIPVAAKHYLQVTDDHFRKAAHNPAQKRAATARNEGNPTRRGSEESVVSDAGCKGLHQDAAPCETAEASENGRYRTRTNASRP